LRLLLVDNFDSFTFNLVAYFKTLGAEVKLVRNDIHPDKTEPNSFNGIVLAPGPGRPEHSGFLMDYLKLQLPTLGICLGHQAIGLHAGAELIHGKPMHGKLSTIHHKADPLFGNIPEGFKVVRYHSLLLDNLPDRLDCLALTERGECMAIKHKDLPYYGLQYHPEAILTEHGHQVLKNWMNLL
jgi:anthranilate synthase/aminodeoxychorismate synthase-like glutamine amidotransferase